mgnify:FL=1
MRHFLLLSKSSVIVVLPAVFARSRCANSKTSFNFFSKPSHKQQPGFVYKIKTLSLSGTSFEEDGEEDEGVDAINLCLSGFLFLLFLLFSLGEEV